eukprot:9914569-Prorocentrum_lima.AAC.1
MNAYRTLLGTLHRKIDVVNAIDPVNEMRGNVAAATKAAERIEIAIGTRSTVGARLLSIGRTTLSEVHLSDAG